MSEIKLDKIEVSGNSVLFDYSASDDLKKYFDFSQPFFIEYDENISNVPEAILAIPFLANFLPVAWLTDSVLSAACADKTFVEKAEAVKQGFIDMFPLAKFGGSLAVQNTVDCSFEKTDKTAAFFSGGVDSYCALIRNLQKKPALMTIWGSDLYLTDTAGWSKVKDNTISTALTFGLEKTFIKSSFRQVLNYGELNRLSSAFTKRGWWGSIQHGIAITAHSAPYIWLHKISAQYIGASFCSKDINVHCASYPSIDENVAIGSCRTVHDSFDFDRQQKIDEIVSFRRKTGLPVNLRVCWQSKGGGNCCSCEKCFRTIMGIVAAGADPKDFGFDMSADPVSLKKIKTFVIWSESGGVSLDYLWNPIKNKIKNNKQMLKKSGTYKDIKWLLAVDFSAVENNRFRRRQQTVVNIKLAVKRVVPDSVLRKLKKQSLKNI